MISPDRSLVQKEVYNFLRTVTIRYEPIAGFINESLIKNGIAVNFENKSTWKYYLNLVGQYHPSDALMYVTSLDTQEKILFSVENLKTHLRTKAVYAPGGAYYDRLCDLYPKQVDLIKSILFPVESLEKAIASPDLTLLGYGKGYLEEYEESVIVRQIEEFLDILKERWYFDFLDDEPYFNLTFWTSLWTYLAMLIMSARVANIKTPYVHSWDVWNELAANGLDNYSDILDRKKSMMLYQNIDYLRANAGKQSNLLILAERLLGDFGIGLYGRKVVQEAETGDSKYQLTPQFVPVLLGNVSNALPAQIEIKSTANIQAEIFEKGLTSSDSAEMVSAVERKLGDTTLNEFFTKFIEIKPIAQHRPYAETLNMFLLETLLVSITEGYYTKSVEVLDPLTRLPIYLKPAELLALYHYATQKSIGVDEDTIPTQSQLYLSFLPQIGTPRKFIYHYGRILRLSEQADAVSYLAGLEYNKTIGSPEDFSNDVTRLWLRFMDHRLADQGTLLEARYEVFQYLSSLCHQRRYIDITLVEKYDRYSTWLGIEGIDIADTILVQYGLQDDPKVQWANLADAIISTLIPINETLLKFGNFTLSDFGFERLRQLFVQMCSYRVVVLESERDTPEVAVGPKWSTAYGPDAVDTHSDFIIGTEVIATNRTQIITNDAPNAGVSCDVETSTTTHASYTVTMTTSGHNQSQQTGESPGYLGSVGTITTTHGAVDLHYNPPLPEIPLEA